MVAHPPLPARLALAALALLSTAATAQSTPRPIPYPVVEPAAWQQAVANGTRSESGAPGPKHWTDHVDYAITATLDPESAKVTGHVRATYHNRSPERLRTLWLHLRQNLHQEGAVRNRNVVVTGGATIDNVHVNDEEARSRVQDTRLRIVLPGGLEPDQKATVDLDFEFTVPPAGGAPRMGHEKNHVFYLGYWYPQFAVRDDVEDWVCETYRGNGEFYMPYGNYDLKFTAPEGFLVRATGVLQNPEACLTKDAVDRLARAKQSEEVVAIVTADDLEAGRATRAGNGKPLTWHFVAEDVRDCAVSASDHYVWDATHAKVPGRDEPVEIHAVYEPESRTWPEAAAIARHTIEWMSREVHPYPWPHMTACEGIIGGGMEYPMMTVIGDSRSIRGLQGVVCHELIHMWFPMIVGSNEKRHSWMDEGTTSFFTDLCSAALRDTPNNSRGNMLGYVRAARSGGESPLMTHADFYPQGYGFASYTKPAALLHQLRELMRDGDRDVFMEAVRAYVAEWRFKHPSPYDMWRTFERFAGRDLDWYWRSFYFETWTLDHAIAGTEQQGDETIVTIEDRGQVPFPCIVEARYDEGETQRRTVPVEHWLAGNTTAKVTFPGKPNEVVLDPDMNALDVDR